MDTPKIDEILQQGDTDEAARRREHVRARFWSTARRAARHIPFMDDIVAAYYCAMDERTPTRVRGTLLAALAYFVVPTDMIPDFLVGLGFTDDAAVLAAAIAAIRSHLTAAHRAAARKALFES